MKTETHIKYDGSVFDETIIITVNLFPGNISQTYLTRMHAMCRLAEMAWVVDLLIESTHEAYDSRSVSYLP